MKIKSISLNKKIPVNVDGKISHALHCLAISKNKTKQIRILIKDILLLRNRLRCHFFELKEKKPTNTPF